MKDLIRTYRMIIKRKDESDSESQPLMSSSCSSTESFGAIQDRFVFNHEAETTDTELDQRKTIKEKLVPALVPSALPKPLILSNQFDQPPLENYTRSDTVYESYKYYNKCPEILDNHSLVQTKLVALSWRDYHQDEPRRTNSSLVTIFAIWNTIMGTSLLAMSWGIEKSGLFPGLSVILILGGICLYTAHVIVKVSQNQGEGLEVPDLCKLYYGTWLEYIAKFFSLVVLMGACIVYWVLMSNFLYNSVHFIYDFINYKQITIATNDTVLCLKNVQSNANTTNPALQILNTNEIFENVWNLYNTVPIIVAIIMFPILNFKSPTFFTKFNSLGAISVMYIIVFVAIKASTWGINIIDWSMEFNLKSNFCALSGMLSLSYFIHNIIISVIKNNKHQEKNGRDLTIAYGLVTFTYVFVSVIFYISFPLAKSCIEDNFLNNFAKSDVLTVIARVLLLFQLFTVFPLIAFMLRRDILVNLSQLFRKPRIERYTSGRVVFLNMIVVMICILFACFMPRIGTLIRFTGAFSGVVYIFTLPSLLKIALLRKQGNLTYSSFVLHATIIVIGILNLISQFFVEEN